MRNSSGSSFLLGIQTWLIELLVSLITGPIIEEDGWIIPLKRKISMGKATKEDLNTLLELAEVIKETSFRSGADINESSSDSYEVF